MKKALITLLGILALYTISEAQTRVRLGNMPYLATGSQAVDKLVIAQNDTAKNITVGTLFASTVDSLAQHLIRIEALEGIAGGAGPFSRTGNYIEMVNSGDTILLETTNEVLAWGDGGEYIYSPSSNALQIGVDGTPVIHINPSTVYLYKSLIPNFTTTALGALASPFDVVHTDQVIFEGDILTYIQKDGSGNLTLADQVAGEYTLTELAAGTASGGSTVDTTEIMVDSISPFTVADGDAYFLLGTKYAEMKTIDGSDEVSIKLHNGVMTITDEKYSKGIIAAADFSTNYTDRSYVDKAFTTGYVDDAIAALSIDSIFQSIQADSIIEIGSDGVIVEEIKFKDGQIGFNSGLNEYIDATVSSIEFYVNAVKKLDVGDTVISLGSTVDLSVSAGSRMFLDGGDDTYLYQTAGNTITAVAGDVEQMDITSSAVWFFDDVLPAPTSTYALGAPSYIWKTVFTDSIVFSGTTAVYEDVSGNLVFDDGVSAAKTLTELLSGGAVSYDSSYIHARVDSLWAQINDTTSASTVIPLLSDVVPLFVFGGGGANSGDTDCFTTNTFYGSFLNSSADTLVITKMNVVMQGTTPSVAFDVMWNTSLTTTGATHLMTTPPTCTSITTGTSKVTADFDNVKVPPGYRIFAKTPTVTTKPTYLEATISGYKINTE